MFGYNLRKYRKEKGYSQNDLAQKLFVTRQCVSKWEKGVTQPDLQTLTKLSELLGISVDALLKGNDLDTPKQNFYNRILFISNILAALFCLLSFFALWRFLPQTVPAHWTNCEIDRYGSRNEIFINCISVGVFFAIDVVLYLILRKIDHKKIACITHVAIAIFQVAYLIFIVVLYAAYISDVLLFVNCLCASGILCLSIAMHPKICKQNCLFGVRTKETLESTTVWHKTHVFACLLFSIWSLIVFSAGLIWISKFVLLLLFGYLFLTAGVIVYSKKI